MARGGCRVGRVEDGRGSLGPMAALRFPSPLIEPACRSPASGSPTGFTASPETRRLEASAPGRANRRRLEVTGLRADRSATCSRQHSKQESRITVRGLFPSDSRLQSAPRSERAPRLFGRDYTGAGLQSQSFVGTVPTAPQSRPSAHSSRQSSARPSELGGPSPVGRGYALPQPWPAIRRRHLYHLA
jgi:hypothetical protein